MSKLDLSKLIAELRVPKKWCCIFLHEEAMRHGSTDVPFRAADTLEQQAAEVLRLSKALERIAEFGDPWEIAEEPEDFGGTDDGLETVCMVYDNIQSIARATLSEKRP